MTAVTGAEAVAWLRENPERFGAACRMASDEGDELLEALATTAAVASDEKSLDLAARKLVRDHADIVGAFISAARRSKGDLTQ